MKKFAILLTGILFLGLISGAWAKGGMNPETLRVALLPDEDAATIIKQNQGLKKYLETALNKKVKLVVATDYSSMIEAMRHGRLELAYFGPLSYVLAKQKSNIAAFAAREKKGSTTYQSVLIGNKKAAINSIKDIYGKTMVYGDPASTSSHLIPKSVLLETGLEAKKDYSEHFLGAHDAVAVAVQSGKADAGGLSRPIFESLVERGIISLDKVKVLKYSKPYPQYPWTVRMDLDPALIEKIKHAFWNLKDKEVLKAFKASGFGKMTDEDYDIIRNLAKILELDLSA